MNVSQTLHTVQYLRVDLEVTLPSQAGINSEFSRFVYNDTSRLQARTVGFYLQQHKNFFIPNLVTGFILTSGLSRRQGITFSGNTSLAAGRI